MRERLTLDGVVTVIDVTRIGATLPFDLAVEQLGFADVVVLSHVDEAAAWSALDASAVHTELQRYAPAAVFAESRRGQLVRDLRALLSERAEALHPPPETSGHSSIEAVSLMLDGELDEDRFTNWVESALADVEARILRVKGILALRGVDERVIVQGVSDAVGVELGRPWAGAERKSRLVVLGLGLDAALLEAGFRRCAAGELATVVAS
jgi:G3E family GTPase